MCHHWSIPKKDPASVRRELKLETIRRVVEGSRLLQDIEGVVLTGGEPLLRKDLPEIAGCLSDAFPKARVGVLSNLMDKALARNMLGRLRERGVRGLWLGSSLDGLAAAHDRIRGKRGAFRGLMDTIGMVRKEFPGLELSLNFTITPENHEQLWPAYQFSKELGAWFGAQLVVEHRGLEAPKTFAWTRAQLESVRESTERVLLDIARGEGALRALVEGRQAENRGLWGRLLYWRLLGLYALEPRRFFSDCLAGSRYAMLDPAGELFFCPVNKHRKVGSVLEGFDAVWSSGRADSERRFAASKRCHCCLVCVVNPVLDRLLAEGVPS